MYCKHCGKEISDDSKFCQYCGGKQDVNYSTPNSIHNNNDDKDKKVKVVEIPTIKIKTNFSETTKWSLIAYCIWFLFNLYWLLVGGKSYNATEIFVPFHIDGTYDDYYDITEFLVYVVGVPLAIWVIRKLWKLLLDSLSDAT